LDDIDIRNSTAMSKGIILIGRHNIVSGNLFYFFIYK